MKKYISMIAACLMMVSCIDTVILPDDKTVDEDFWKSRDYVDMMVYKAYNSMLSNAVIERLIVWGDLRSDELLPVTSVTFNAGVQEDLTEINTANTQPDNRFATWGSIYSVINNCNIVLDRAARVMDEDPSYTEGDYLAHCSQMLALRALCYFYLVRNFRDVAYVTEPYMNSSQDPNTPQASPDSVLNNCIRDLEEAERNSVLASAYADWRRVGIFTRDGIDALLADIYLWRGSIKRSNADYQHCIDYCDKVIESKKAQHQAGRREIEEKEFPLIDGRQAFTEIFINQNSEESIFELQFPGNATASNILNNVAVREYYANYNGSRPSYLRASTQMTYGQNGAFMIRQPQLLSSSSNDYRGLESTYAPNGDDIFVRKYVAAKGTLFTSGSSQERKDKDYAANYRHNYIVYRLTDVMLMKAEALVAMSDGDEDEAHLRPAFNLAQAVNSRSRITGDSIVWVTWGRSANVKDNLETLVLSERLRELAFEGKRWYDLLRYNFRHTDTPVDYTTTLAEQADRGVSFVANYGEMLSLIESKYVSGGGAVKAKLRSEPYLYMPVPLGDLDICPVLRQNPVYDSSTNISKN